jgi:hypothetical protein
MSTDYQFEYFRGPCLCGRGEIVIIESSPDHGYAKPHQTSWETRVDCPDCESRYCVRVDCRRILVFNRADMAAQQARCDAVAKKTDEMQTYAKSRGYYAQMASVLNKLGAKSQIQRRLSGYYGMCSYQSFLKRFSGGSKTESWLEANLFKWCLYDAVRNLLQIDDPNLKRLHAEREVLATASRMEPSPVAELKA